MSAEQVGQLYELMHATKDVWRSPSGGESVEGEPPVDSNPKGES